MIKLKGGVRGRRKGKEVSRGRGVRKGKRGREEAGDRGKEGRSTWHRQGPNTHINEREKNICIAL